MAIFSAREVVHRLVSQVLRKLQKPAIDTTIKSYISKTARRRDEHGEIGLCGRKTGEEETPKDGIRTRVNGQK